METSVSLLGRLAGRPTADDWRRLLDLYQPLLRALPHFPKPDQRCKGSVRSP